MLSHLKCSLTCKGIIPMLPNSVGDRTNIACFREIREANHILRTTRIAVEESKSFQKFKMRAEEMAQQLSALAAHLEDTGSIPSTHYGSQLSDPGPRGSKILF